MVLGRKTSFFIGQIDLGLKNQFVLREKMVLGFKANFLLGCVVSQTMYFFVFSSKKVVFRSKKWLGCSAQNHLFSWESWYFTPKPYFPSKQCVF